MGRSLDFRRVSFIPRASDLRQSRMDDAMHKPTDLNLGRQIRDLHPRSLFIMGTEDPWYDVGALTDLAQVTQGETLVIPGAGHLLEVPEGTVASLQVMEQVMRVLQTFLEEKP